MNRNAQTSRQLTSRVFGERQAWRKKTSKRAPDSVSLVRFYTRVAARERAVNSAVASERRVCASIQAS